MALGNIIGSNVFNVLLIIGVTAMVAPIARSAYAAQLVEFDIWFMLAVSVVFAALATGCRKITRGVGIGCLAAYCAYTVYI